jgi:hypothetical protein
MEKMVESKNTQEKQLIAKVNYSNVKPDAGPKCTTMIRHQIMLNV